LDNTLLEARGRELPLSLCPWLNAPPLPGIIDPDNEMSTRRYFDWAATALAEGNPSSLHGEGKNAREALESARARCAAALGVPADTIYFTSGGTEANALVIHSMLLRPGSAPLLYSAVEHPSVRENCQVLQRLGLFAAAIPVEPDGRVSQSTLSRALAKNGGPRLAAVMGVNNETGALMDLAATAQVLRAQGRRVHFHSDLVQAVGKIPLDILKWDLDSAAMSAHKIGGPRGIGLLYLKKPLEPFLKGGEQERGVRPGTENLAGALALADCLERHAPAAGFSQEEAARRMAALIRGLKQMKKCVLIPEDREEEDIRFSPWILQARFAGIPGEVLVRVMDRAGFALSTGSACSSASVERPVLSAMGLDEAARREGVRISQGWTTTEEDIDALLAALRRAVETT